MAEEISQKKSTEVSKKTQEVIYICVFSNATSENLQTACSSLWSVLLKGLQAIDHVLSEMFEAGLPVSCHKPVWPM